MTQPIRVLVVNPGLAVWGAELYLLGQVDALAERGVELTLASPADSDLGRLWVERGHQLADVPIGKAAGLRRADGTDRRAGVRELFGDLATMARHVRHVVPLARRYDVVHSYSLNTHVDVALAGQLARRPTVLDLVNIVRPGVGRKVLRVAAKMATLTVANSAATAEPLEGEAKLTVIHPGIDLTKFSPGPPNHVLREMLCPDPDVALVGIFGRLDEPKGVHVLIEAFDQLEGDAANARLLVVGERGTGPESYTADLHRHGQGLLGDRVTFLGRRDDVPDLLRTIDVAVNASFAEPFGLNVLEAQACGTPVIGTDAGGIPEFVDHEVSGLLVPAGEAGPLARAIERVLTDPASAQTMAAEAQRRANPARGLEAQYDQLAEVYHRLAQR